MVFKTAKIPKKYLFTPPLTLKIVNTDHLSIFHRKNPIFVMYPKKTKKVVKIPPFQVKFHDYLNNILYFFS